MMEDLGCPREHRQRVLSHAVLLGWVLSWGSVAVSEHPGTEVISHPRPRLQRLRVQSSEQFAVQEARGRKQVGCQWG